MGMKFQASQAAQVNSICYYKVTGESGIHTGRILVVVTEKPPGRQRQTIRGCLALIIGLPLSVIHR
jgi:hypothetical protein